MAVDFVVEAEGLSYRYGRVQAVKDLSLRVKKGEIYGLVGPDGAGKTTTIRMLSAVIPPQSGRAMVAGFDVLRESEKVKERIGYMAQRFNLYEDLTVQENLEFFADLYRVPKPLRRSREQELLSFSRLEGFRGRLAQNLSGGMKQKLALACTLIHSPQVLMLDEPTTGVDQVSRREFWQILSRLLREGVTILYTTPYMDEAERFSRLSFLSVGSVVVSNTPRGLKGLLESRILEVEASPQFEAQGLITTVPGVQDVQRFGNRLHVLVRSIEVRERIMEVLEGRGISVLSVREVTASLEDVFMNLSRPDRALG